MKRVVSILVVILFATLIAMPPQTVEAADTGGLRYTVTVSKFENRAGWSGRWDIGNAWGIIMTDILNQTGRFIVLGETDMRNAAMDEQDFAASGRTVQGAKTPVIGQMTPAQILVKGAITHVQDDTSGGHGGVSIRGFSLGGGNSKSEVNVTMYMVDSTTGQVLASTSVVGRSNKSHGGIGYSGRGLSAGGGGFKNDNVGKAVESAVQQGVDWMIKQLPNIPWSGSVVMTRDGKVYINRGAREGVVAGQEFVVGYSDIIRDPDTGEVLDEVIEEVARIRVTSAKERLSICNVISGDSYAIDKGMKVSVP
ncbi:MAG: CsgG/HfaB family protein [Negativicutes bacterium]|jgi:curli biogenesis system outer membrane secretion channel CsgG